MVPVTTNQKKSAPSLCCTSISLRPGRYGRSTGGIEVCVEIPGPSGTTSSSRDVDAAPAPAPGWATDWDGSGGPGRHHRGSCRVSDGSSPAGCDNSELVHKLHGQYIYTKNISPCPVPPVDRIVDAEPEPRDLTSSELLGTPPNNHSWVLYGML